MSQLPFTEDEFFALFVRYNADIWPAQFLAYLLGLGAVVLVFSRNATNGRVIAVILACMWAWTGSFYHLRYFASINAAAFGFGVLFLIEAAAMAVFALRAKTLHFSYRRDLRTSIGALFIIYAGLVYPLLGLATGHSSSELPAFGVTPCPVTIFTFGLLLLAAKRPPWWIWSIPVGWSLVGGSAAFMLGVVQDWVLLLTGVTALLLWFLPRDPVCEN